MLVLAIPDAAELGFGIDPALEQLLEPVGLDLARKAELFGTGAEPVRRPFLVLGVVIVLGEVAGRCQRRAHDPDRQHGYSSSMRRVDDGADSGVVRW